MVLSQTAIYSLKATLHLAAHSEDGPTRVDDIAEALDVPKNYLSKILHTLTRVGILSSMRGPNGGFTLIREPGSLTLAEVIEPFQDLVNGSSCLLGKEECRDDAPCPAHAEWKSASAALKEFFLQTSVADLAQKAVS